MQLPLSRRNDLMIVLALAAVVLAGTVAFFFRGEEPQFLEYRHAGYAGIADSDRGGGGRRRLVHDRSL